MSRLYINKCIASFFFLAVAMQGIGQTADFNFKSETGSFCNPATIIFEQAATGSPVGYIWDFGNGKTSHSKNPPMFYRSPGTYNVRLIVIYSQSTAEITKTIIINPTVDSTFSVDKKDACQLGPFNFSASATGVGITYAWDFGDGTPTVFTPVKDISHDFTSFGDFLVKLTVTNGVSCASSSTQAVSIQEPTVVGSVTSVKGCAPAVIGFDATVSLLPGDLVTNYLWDFADGSLPVNSGTPTTSHNYNSSGTYSPVLSITTAKGCKSKFNFDTIAFGNPPTSLSAGAVKNVICASEPAVFFANAVNANSYTWDNSDNIDTTSDGNSSYKYRSLGQKRILVTPSFNGCPGLPDSFKITVVGVVANYTFANTCADKNTFSFRNRSLGNVSSFKWNFGDGSPEESTMDPTHTFSTTGIFTTTLIVNDDVSGCSDTFALKIYVSAPSFVNPVTFVCRNSDNFFKITNTTKNPSASYTWNLLGQTFGPLNDSFITVKATLFVNSVNSVIIDNGIRYCPDTLKLKNKILVKAPQVKFTTQDTICLNTPLTLTNNSKPFTPADKIQFWDWNFGDGTINNNAYEPPPHLFTNPRNYLVRLTATDINGCTNTTLKKITANEDGFIYTLPKVQNVCMGQQKELIAYQDASVLWSPANMVSCVDCDTILVSPNLTTTFFATSTTPFGCTATDSIRVNVITPFTATTPVADFYICLNENVTLNAGPAGYNIAWRPATGLSNPNIYSPTASPTSTITYTATLSDTLGCFTSAVDVVVHLNTQPTVDAGPDKFYPFNSPFTLSPNYGNNIVSYQWTPSNQLSCSSCTTPSGTALKKEVYTIEVRSDSGCVAKDGVTIYVECKDANLLLPNAFTPNNDNINDVFYPLARGIKTILNFSIYSREGKLIFQKKDFPPNDKTYGWNGAIGGSATSTAVYVYIMEALCDSGEKLNKKGSFVLLR